MHTGPCPRRKPWPASRSMIGISGVAAARTTAVFQPRACCHLTSRLPLEDSAAGTARRASRGCRQVFGLWARRWFHLLLARRFPGRRWRPSALTGSFPFTAAGQCWNGLGRRHQLPFSSCQPMGRQEPTTTRYGADVTTATPDVGHKLVDNPRHALPGKACRALTDAAPPDPAQPARYGLAAGPPARPARPSDGPATAANHPPASGIRALMTSKT